MAHTNDHAASVTRREQVVIDVKYSGYIRRQEREIQRQEKARSLRIPETFDFHAVPHLRKEAQEKLTRVRPRDLAQAGRISGLTPADLAVLALHVDEPGLMRVPAVDG